MNTKQWLVSSVVAVSVGAAFVSSARAEEQTQGLTRAEVKAQVLQARAHGELMPAGEASQAVVYSRSASTRSRGELRAEVQQARADGDFMARGETISTFGPATAPSTLARAEVRDGVKVARLQGELMPNGEAYARDYHAGRPIHFQAIVAALHR